MNSTENNAHGHSHGDFNKHDLSLVAPVAWMIICGDGLHNFIGNFFNFIKNIMKFMAIFL
jgi:hypothetical protein